jgi:hypothetical protein
MTHHPFSTPDPTLADTTDFTSRIQTDPIRVVTDDAPPAPAADPIPAAVTEDDAAARATPSTSSSSRPADPADPDAAITQQP